MWVYIVTSFTRYNKVGRHARNNFHRALQKDGFFHLHENLYIRHCDNSTSAAKHRERIKKLLPMEQCDVSIILSSDNTEQISHHHLTRKRSKHLIYGKHDDVEFF